MKKLNWFDVADSIALGLPLGFAIGRIGCFLNGCCYGIACKSPVSVVFPVLRDGLPRLPAQLFESAYSLVIFALLLVINRRYSNRGLLFFSFSLLYGFFRFLNEMIRVNPKIIFGLSGSELVSFMMVVASLVYFGFNYRKIRRNGREQS
jgi:phosphatidylglycerol:prolipoprotein diacylglycerol transferase